MKTIKVAILIIISMFYCNVIWAQFAPGQDLGDVDLTGETADIASGEKPFIRWINNTSSYIKDAEFYSIYYGSRRFQWNEKYELFRVQANGTTCLFQAGDNNGAALEYYTQVGRKWRGSLDNNGTDMNLRSLSKIKFMTNTNNEIMRLAPDGVAIYDNMFFYKGDVQLIFGLNGTRTSGWIGSADNTGCYMGAGGRNNVYYDTNYGVYIGGITATDVEKYKADLKDKYKLFVKKGVLSEDFAIAPSSSWADFVFHQNYNLRSLPEVERFIKTNKHLPDVPSAKDVAENGYSQHEINKALLQKVEELTLYVIELQKQIKELKNE